jgi:hypothetical protein
MVSSDPDLDRFADAARTVAHTLSRPERSIGIALRRVIEIAGSRTPAHILSRRELVVGDSAKGVRK